MRAFGAGEEDSGTATGAVERLARSFRMAVLCLSAELKVVFYEHMSVLDQRKGKPRAAPLFTITPQGSSTIK